MEVHRRTDRQPDGQTDVQADSYIPPPKLCLRGYNDNAMESIQRASLPNYSFYGLTSTQA